MNVASAEQEMHKTVAMVARPAVSASTPNEQIDQHRNRIHVISAIERATQAADRGDLAEGRRILDEARTMVMQSVSASAEMSANLLRDIDQIVSGMRERDQYDRYTSKMSKARVMSHMQQRCNYSNYSSEMGDFDQATEAYQTSSKVAMKRAFKNK